MEKSKIKEHLGYCLDWAIEYPKTQFYKKSLMIKDYCGRVKVGIVGPYVVFVILILAEYTYNTYLTEIYLSFANIIFFLISVCVLLINLYNIYKETYSYNFSTDEHNLDEVKLNDKEKGLGYDFIKKDEHGHRVAIYSKNINDRLIDKEFKYSLDNKKFVISDQSKRVKAFVINRKKGVCFNGCKIRLLSEDFVCEKKMRLMYTDYYDGECTNESALVKIKVKDKDEDSENIVFTGSSLWTNNGIILEIENSFCSNYIGVSTLAITRDSRLILIQQSYKSAQFPDEMAPSGSGSAEKKDFVDDNFSKSIINGMERELLEENGFRKVKRKDYSRYIKKTKIIGFSRVLSRGGKPEFFGFTILDIHSKECKLKGAETLLASDIIKTKVNLNSKDFIDTLNKELDGERKSSVSLFLNIKFLINFIETHKEDYLERVRLLDSYHDDADVSKTA